MKVKCPNLNMFALPPLTVGLHSNRWPVYREQNVCRFASPAACLLAQTLGGSNFVDKDSSLEYWGDVKFLHNTLAYPSDDAWVSF